MNKKLQERSVLRKISENHHVVKVKHIPGESEKWATSRNSEIIARL
jgi:hypothetical protein